MADPYAILDVSPGIDETALRRRYLELVRQNPPEKCPQRFAEIQEAYEQLRDPTARMHRQLFRVDTGESLDDIIVDLRSRQQTMRIPTDVLLSLGGR